MTSPGPDKTAEAELFVDTADLSKYDLSGVKPVRFEFEKKSAQLNMRVPEALLEAVKKRSSARGIPYTRFIREAVESALKYLRDENGRRYLVLGGYDHWHGIPRSIFRDEEGNPGDTLLVIAKRYRDDIDIYVGPFQPLLRNKTRLPTTRKPAAGGSSRLWQCWAAYLPRGAPVIACPPWIQITH